MKKIISFILIATGLLSSVAFAEFDAETIKLYKEMIQDVYYQDVSEDLLMESAIKGMFNSLDAYSRYYNAEETKIFNESVSGEYVGIGIKMEEMDGYIHINKVFKDSSADKAGLCAGDYIIAIDGESIEGWTAARAASYIKEGEIGSNVTLTIQRGETSTVFNLLRSNVQVESCSLEILEGNVGYIKIEEFNSTTYKDFKKYIHAFEVIGVNKLIIDLRDNTGGYLSHSVEVAKLLVPKGLITTVKYKDEEETTSYFSSLQEKKFDLVVLVNGYTASASEIFAGAIKDTKAGVIIGTQTFGKGVVQRMYSLKNGGSVKITVAEYLTPNGTSINGIGITPDIVIEDKEEQLSKAISVLCGG